MRTNRELFKAWYLKTVRHEEYVIEIGMFIHQDGMNVTVWLVDNDSGEDIDYECVYANDIVDTDVPPSEMVKKFKSTVKYFSEHFENVLVLDEKAIIV